MRQKKWLHREAQNVLPRNAANIHQLCGIRVLVTRVCPVFNCEPIYVY